MRSEGYIVGELSVCYSTSHFSNVFSSHKRYYLLNGQWRSEQLCGSLWKCSVAKLEREKGNCKYATDGKAYHSLIYPLCVPRRRQKMQRRACIASRMLSCSVVSPRQTLRELAWRELKLNPVHQLVILRMRVLKRERHVTMRRGVLFIFCYYPYKADKVISFLLNLLAFYIALWKTFAAFLVLAFYMKKSTSLTQKG